LACSDDKQRTNIFQQLFGENPPLSTYLNPSSEVLTQAEDIPIGRTRSANRHSISDSGSLSREYGSKVAMHTYSQALSSLQYLASNDPSSLSKVIHDLGDDGAVASQQDMTTRLSYQPTGLDAPAMTEEQSNDSPTNMSPITPEFNKTTFKVLRKRAGKLSWLLGNPIAATIGSQQDPTWSNAALDGLLGDIQASAEVDARDGLIDREALEAIRSQVVDVKKGVRME
jgi:hypothetical protein